MNKEYNEGITKNTVSLNEVVELFISSAVLDIMEEYDVPKFNIIFSDEAISWFRELLKTSLKNEGSSISNMTNDDIDRLSRDNQSDPNCPTIVVKDYRVFFELLTDIINSQISLYNDYGINKDVTSVSLMLLKMIWLRMGIEDFDNVELFLEKQLEFLENREFDNPLQETYLKDYNETKITYEVEMSEIWCESTRRIYFRMYDGNEYHDLPKIYYDICEENGKKVCYISAVQMGLNRHRIKSVERKLYKLNKDIPNSEVHPNFVMAMSLFYEFLLLHNIDHVKVPLLQVLSYRYHEILSEQQKQFFRSKWNKEKLDYLNFLKDSDRAEYDELLEDYELDKDLYNRFADKEDLISKNKIDGLINLFMYMTYIDESQINTEPYINASYLDISLYGSRNLNRR